MSSKCVTLRRFHENDVIGFAPRSDPLTPGVTEGGIILAASAKHSYTILIYGKPAVIMGIHIMWSGVAQVWATVSNLIRGHGLTFTKICNSILDNVALKDNIRRYNAIVHSKSSENIRWIYLLKFRYEFTMKNAAPDGADIFGYVRWRS